MESERALDAAGTGERDKRWRASLDSAHGVFRSAAGLQAAIHRFIAEHNQEPKPFVWRKDPDAIIAAVKRGSQTLESIH